MRESEAAFDPSVASSTDALRLHLIAKRRRFVLIIDKFECVYKQGRTLTETVYRIAKCAALAT